MKHIAVDSGDLEKYNKYSYNKGTDEMTHNYNLQGLIAQADQQRKRDHEQWDQFVDQLENPLRDRILPRHPDTQHLRAFMAHRATGIHRHTRLIHKLQHYFDQQCPDLSLRPESGLIEQGEPAADYSHNWHGRDDMFEVRAQRKGSPEARELEQLMKQRKQG